MSEFSGRDLGRRILSGLRAYVARSLGEIHARIESLQQAIDNTPTIDIMRGEIDAAVGRLQPEPISAEALRPILESVLAGEVAKWALDFERRAQAQLERVIDRIPTPKDGVDGEPGGSVEDFDISIDGRVLTVAMKIGDRIQSRTVRLDFPMERGVYQAGKGYEKSDIVTYGGSQFIATRDTTEKEKPESSPAWRLVVKRGRDGKDSE